MLVLAPSYTNVHDAQFFGRGHIAGIDVIAQKREKSKFYDDLLEQRRTREQEEQEARRLKKERDKLARTKHDDRHWKDKPLDQMTERDWRIFREDFNIAVRGLLRVASQYRWYRHSNEVFRRLAGGQIPTPLRFWKEANLRSEIMEIIDDLG